MLASNHIPWIIAAICLLSCISLTLSIRIMLARENKQRDAEPRDESFDNVYVVKIDDDGNRTEVKVSKVRVTGRFILQAHAIV